MRQVSSTHKDLDIWQVAMDMVSSVYSMTCRLPNDEKFGLVAQMRRAAVSVPSNIAEGAARGSSAEFSRFLSIAQGSLAELETQIELVTRLKLCTVDTRLLSQVARIRQMNSVLIQRLRARV